MNRYFTFVVLIGALTGCASSQAQTPAPTAAVSTPASCPTSAAELDSLKTEAQVTACFGESSTKTRKPDGRHTALYEFGKGVLVVFLFDKDGSVIRNRVYQDNSKSN